MIELNQITKNLNNKNSFDQTKATAETMLLIYGTPEENQHFINRLNKLNTSGQHEVNVREFKLINVSFHEKKKEDVKKVILETGLSWTQAWSKQIPQIVLSYLDVALSRLNYKRIKMENLNFPELQSGSELMVKPYCLPIATKDLNSGELFREYEN